ncbi:MAG: hypothetical protein KatS3mg101_0259 [Patescibacteria group bacterium]|nr:MAG: hypothetical protein KatS3mg101_0259 [Patescibacteria group bacterium]
MQCFSTREGSVWGHVGRFKLNKSLGLNIPNDPDHRLLTLEDLIKIVSKIIELNNESGCRMMWTFWVIEESKV